jgi:hypothetical protein
MAISPTTAPSPGTQQMDRSNDPDQAEAMDRDAAAEAMRSEHQTFAGSAEGIGSVGFDESGAFDVGAAAPSFDIVDPPRDDAAPGPSPGPLETGEEFRTAAEVADRDPGDAAGSLSPDQPDPLEVRARTGVGDDAGPSSELGSSGPPLDDLGEGAPAPNVTAGGENEAEDARRLHGQAQGSADADRDNQPDPLREARGRGSMNPQDSH